LFGWKKRLKAGITTKGGIGHKNHQAWNSMLGQNQFGPEPTLERQRKLCWVVLVNISHLRFLQFLLFF